MRRRSTAVFATAKARQPSHRLALRNLLQFLNRTVVGWTRASRATVPSLALDSRLKAEGDDELVAPLLRPRRKCVNPLAREDRKSTRLNSSHYCASHMPSSAGKTKDKLIHLRKTYT